MMQYRLVRYVFTPALLACLLLTTLPASSQETGPQQGLLWQITAPGGQTSYLLGTLHSEDRRVLRLADDSSHYLQQSRLLVLEIVPDQAMQQQARQYMLLPESRQLSHITGRPLFAKASRLMQQHGVTAQLLERMKPWAVYVTLGTPVPGTGIFLDRQLYRMAQRWHKPVRGLETIEEQLGIFDNLSMTDQLSLLREVIDQYPDIARQTEALTRAYLERDLRRLQHVALSQMQPDNPLEKKLQQQLIHERNRRMAQRLQPLLADGRIFVAVGALHLPGYNGLLELLRQQGYRITAEF
jgi:uncharacterized protein YbaP (TraB family)